LLVDWNDGGGRACPGGNAAIPWPCRDSSCYLPDHCPEMDRSVGLQSVSMKRRLTPPRSPGLEISLAEPVLEHCPKRALDHQPPLARQ
jgi:hypothetical protein